MNAFAWFFPDATMQRHQQVGRSSRLDRLRNLPIGSRAAFGIERKLLYGRRFLQGQKLTARNT